MTRETLLVIWCAAGLGGCALGGEESEAAYDTLVHFEQQSLAGPTVYSLSIEANREFLAQVAVGPVDPPCRLAAGPRLVGQFSQQEFDELLQLLGESANYASSGEDTDRSCGPSRNGFSLRIWPNTEGLSEYFGTFPEQSADSRTKAMLDRLSGALREAFARGQPFNASDEARAAERDWPTP